MADIPPCGALANGVYTRHWQPVFHQSFHTNLYANSSFPKNLARASSIMASNETQSTPSSADSTNQNISTQGEERKPTETSAGHVINKKPPPPLPPKKRILGHNPVTHSEIASTTTADVLRNEIISIPANNQAPSGSESEPLGLEPSTASNGGSIEHA